MSLYEAFKELIGIDVIKFSQGHGKSELSTT